MTEDRPQIGDVRMLYTIDPYGLDGKLINGGNHYANADTAEGARRCAERMLRGGKHLGYTLGGVRVYGREVRLGGGGWRNVVGGRADYFTLTREGAGEPPAWMTAERWCWDTTVMDYPERVHAMRSDGTCQCGNPAAGYGGGLNGRG